MANYRPQGYGNINENYQGYYTGNINTGNVQGSHQPIQPMQQNGWTEPPAGDVIPPTFTSVTESIRDERQYNAHSHFLRPTVEILPTSLGAQQKAQIPIGFIIQPLSVTPVGGLTIPTANFGSNSVVRCRKCRTYINPFVKWESNGRVWICNLCGIVNETPPFYTRPLDRMGRREDGYERCELSSGSVEFIAPADYMVRPPQPPTYLFVIDVSMNAMCCGILDTACKAIKQLTDQGLPGASRSMIGIITYDASIHFYDFNFQSGSPKMLVVSDLENPFLPLSDSLIVNLQDNINGIANLLDRLPLLWEGNAQTDNCMGSALRGALMAAEHIGGKILLFTSGLPTIGELAVCHHQSASQKSSSMLAATSLNAGLKQLTGQKDPDPAKVDSDNFKNFSELLVQAQISVEAFVCSPRPVNISNILTMTKLTAGDIHYMPGFSSQSDSYRLYQEIINVVQRETGWEAVMRVRAGRGWKIKNWYGNFFFRGNDLLVLPNCHSDQTFGVQLIKDETANSNVGNVYVQAALLYTSSQGERRIRVHTYSFSQSQNATDILSIYDPQAVARFLCYEAVETAMKTRLFEATNFLQSKCSQIISNASGANQNSQTILVQYILGLIKSAAFRDTAEVSNDMRLYYWNRLISTSLSHAIAFMYPRLYCLSEICESFASKTSLTEEDILSTVPLGLTSQWLSRKGCYLLDDGEMILIWAGEDIPTEFLSQTFGVTSIQDIHPEMAIQMIESTKTKNSKTILEFIHFLRKDDKPLFPIISFAKQGHPNEQMFFSSLIEDPTPALMLSYHDFYNKLDRHRPVASYVSKPIRQG